MVAPGSKAMGQYGRTIASGHMGRISPYPRSCLFLPVAEIAVIRDKTRC